MPHLVTATSGAPDVETTWRGWALAAEAADEPELALRLWTAGGPGAAGWESHVGAARALLLLGRVAEAMAAARELHHASRLPGDRVDLVVAAVHAAAGDDAAYAYLLAAARSGRAAVPPAEQQRLVAAAAQARGRERDAAEAWVALAELGGARAPFVAVRCAEALVAGRDRTGDPVAMRTDIMRARVALEAVDPPVWTDPSPVEATVDRLVDRGDPAGARLLLAAVRASDLPLPGLKQLERRVTPVLRVVVTATVAFVALLALMAVLIALRANPRSAAVLGLATGCMTLWARVIPIPGLTRAESSTFRKLRGMRDGRGELDWSWPASARRRGRADAPRRNTGLRFGGAVLGGVAATSVIVWLCRPGGSLSKPEDAGRAFAVWVVLMGVLMPLGYAAFRALDEAAGRRRTRRAARARTAVAAEGAAQCACGHQAFYDGAAATEYTASHLVHSGWAPPRTVPDARVTRCPRTSATWLVGPVGERGRPLALNGLTRL